MSEESISPEDEIIEFQDDGDYAGKGTMQLIYDGTDTIAIVTTTPHIEESAVILFRADKCRQAAAVFARMADKLEGKAE